MRTATIYRRNAKNLKSEVEQHNYNDADEPQFEVCEFSDGRVAQRWLVGKGSCVWWDSWEDLSSVHIYAHPDYGTVIKWSDGTTEYK